MSWSVCLHGARLSTEAVMFVLPPFRLAAARRELIKSNYSQAGDALLCSPTAVDWQSCAAHLGGSFRAQKYRKRPDLLGTGKFMRWLFFGQ